MTADLNAMDNSLSASTLPPDPPIQPPFVCSYVPKARKMDPGTYSLPSTPPSDLPLSTKLTFARDSVLSKLGLGEKSEAQLKEEELEKKREEERVVRLNARRGNNGFGDSLAGAASGGFSSLGGGGGR